MNSPAMRTDLSYNGKVVGMFQLPDGQFAYIFEGASKRDRCAVIGSDHYQVDRQVA